MFSLTILVETAIQEGDIATLERLDREGYIFSTLRKGKERKLLSPLVYKLWNVYLERGDKVVELLYHWYQGENEPLLYLILATLIFVVPDKINREFTLGAPINSQELYEQAFTQKKEPPAWAIDRHTKEGNKKRGT